MKQVTVKVIAQASAVTADPIVKKLSVFYEFEPAVDDGVQGYRGSFKTKPKPGRIEFPAIIRWLNSLPGLKQQFKPWKLDNAGKLVTRGETAENGYMIELGANYIFVLVDEGNTAFG